MISTRRVAREVLPLVVIAWATFVILGGAAKAVENSASPERDAAVSAGLGLCTVMVAAVLGGGLVKRALRAPGASVPAPRPGAARLFAPRPPGAYAGPLVKPPPLQLLQVLRT